MHGQSIRLPWSSSHTPPHGKALFILFSTCLVAFHFSSQVLLSAALNHIGFTCCRPPSPGGGVFFLSSPYNPYFLYLEVGEAPAVRELLMRPPHRSRWQNEAPVVRCQSPTTFPSLYRACLSVSPYGQHARHGSPCSPFLQLSVLR